MKERVKSLEEAEPPAPSNDFGIAKTKSAKVCGLQNPVEFSLQFVKRLEYHFHPCFTSPTNMPIAASSSRTQVALPLALSAAAEVPQLQRSGAPRTRDRKPIVLGRAVSW